MGKIRWAPGGGPGSQEEIKGKRIIESEGQVRSTREELFDSVSPGAQVAKCRGDGPYKEQAGNDLEAYEE